MREGKMVGIECPLKFIFCLLYSVVHQASHFLKFCKTSV